MHKIIVLTLFMLFAVAATAYATEYVEFSVGVDSYGADGSDVNYWDGGFNQSAIFGSNIDDTNVRVTAPSDLALGPDDDGYGSNDNIDGLSYANNYIPFCSPTVITANGYTNVPAVTRSANFNLSWSVVPTGIGEAGTGLNASYNDPVRAGSTSRVGADVYRTYVSSGLNDPNGTNNLQYRYDHLGLLFTDNIDALGHPCSDPSKSPLPGDGNGVLFSVAQGSSAQGLGGSVTAMFGNTTGTMGRSAIPGSVFFSMKDGNNWLFANPIQIGLEPGNGRSGGDDMGDFLFYVRPGYIQTFRDTIQLWFDNVGDQTIPILSPFITYDDESNEIVHDMVADNHDLWVSSGYTQFNFAMVFVPKMGVKGYDGSAIKAIDDWAVKGYSFFTLFDGMNYIFTTPSDLGLDTTVNNQDMLTALDNYTVPEPSTYILLGMGLSGLAWFARTRLRKSE